MKVESYLGSGIVYEVNVQISPLPKNCLDCPFYQHEGVGEFGEDIFGCIFCTIEDNFGIGVSRYKDCPLEKEDN